MPAGFIAFELDLMGAVLDQLIPKLDEMAGEALTRANAQQLPDAQGVYLLIHQGRVHYVGKTDAEAGLRTRLTRHVAKFEHRDHISPADVSFKAAQILVLTAMDIETKLIKRYRADWNGSGFGSNDPGRQRETTAKPPQGFDARFPINIDLPINFLTPGTRTAHEVLMELKLGHSRGSAPAYPAQPSKQRMPRERPPAQSVHTAIMGSRKRADSGR